MVNDRISSVKVSLVILPLQKPASDAQVLTWKRGRMHVPSRPGLGFSISEQARSWAVTTDTFTETHRLAPQHSNA